MNVRTHLEDELLNLVEKPSRYLGNEVNAVHKNLEDVEVRLALVFPDLYDLGLGNRQAHPIQRQQASLVFLDEIDDFQHRVTPP